MLKQLSQHGDLCITMHGSRERGLTLLVRLHQIGREGEKGLNLLQIAFIRRVSRVIKIIHLHQQKKLIQEKCRHLGLTSSILPPRSPNLASRAAWSKHRSVFLNMSFEAIERKTTHAHAHTHTPLASLLDTG